MTKTLSVPISPGELLDKISILEIKSDRIADPDKRHNVERELDLLTGLWHATSLENAELTAKRTELKRINETLWDVEDALRECERNNNFSERFIELARTVYRTNDQRAGIKREINQLLGSNIVEEKSYQPYD